MYSYTDAIRDDVITYIRDENLFSQYDRDDLYDKLLDDLWTEDSVTGNGSGSYTFSSEQAKEYLMGDPDTEDNIGNMIKEYCLDSETIAAHLFDWEYWDVSLRCYLLGQAIDEALDELAGLN